MNKNEIKILSFDPGSTTMGWSVSIYNKKTGNLTVKRFGTMEPKKVVSRVAMREQTEKYGTRLMSLSYIKEQMIEILRIHQPHCIVAESAFFCSRFPNAFAALVQVVNVIDMVAMELMKVQVYKISPKLAKHAMTGKGTSGKLDMITAVKNSEHIKFQQRKNLDDMTEHEADSIAIAYAFVVQLLPGVTING